VPNLLFGDGPISVHDTVLDETKTELSAHVAHGLARAACLPGDMNQWDSMNSGQIFRHVTRGMMMVNFSSFNIFFASLYSLDLYFITSSSCLFRLPRASFQWSPGSLT
jgi:hypothetical protein